MAMVGSVTTGAHLQLQVKCPRRPLSVVGVECGHNNAQPRGNLRTGFAVVSWFDAMTKGWGDAGDDGFHAETGAPASAACCW